MSAMEKSLRRALEAGNASDPAFRDTIYTASERALERLLAEKPTGEETAHARRVLLAETINRIEADYFAAFGNGPDERISAGADEEGTAPAPDHPVNQEDEERFIAESEASLSRWEEPLPPSWAGGENDVALADETQLAAAPSATGADDAEASAAFRPKAGYNWRGAPQKRRPFGKFGPVVVLVLLAVLAGIYFVYGAVLDPLQKRGDAAGTAGAVAADAEWINLFDGTKLDVVATPAGGTVESVTVRGKPAVRLAPATKGGEINIAIGPGVVKEIAGQTVRVEIVAGSSDGKSREFGLRCLFGDQTVCARQRFQTSQASEAFVFDMAVPQDPSRAGVLAIDPTIGTGTGDLDLYSVRLQGLGKG